MQTAVVLRRRALERDSQGIRHKVSELDLPGAGPSLVSDRSLIHTFLEGVPFELTGAQREALGRILTDLSQPVPMHRLLQGDVGSGKTVVAVAALLGAVQGGHQGALMAPTAVLAEQHHAVVRSLTAALSVADPDRLGGERPLGISLLTNRTPASERARIRQGLELGTVDLVVGTHALLTEDVRFHSLGVVVIDEQHRFGVEQRAALRDKGRSADAHPDLLVMTATPIPRTAAMVLFGDLDMTVLDESPPGRRPVETVWARTPADDDAAWERVRSEVAAGRRAYVVCPLVEGSTRIEAKSAVAEADRLARQTLAGIPLTLLHGQMSAADREASMASFRRGSHPVMVATTVIEVGVDVPEATVMVIEDARALRHRPTPPAPRPGRPVGRPELVLPPRARVDAGSRRTPERPRVLDRRIRPCRGGPRRARRGNDPGRPPDRPQRSPPGLAAAGSGPARAGPRGGRGRGRGGPISRRPRGAL